MKKIFSAVSATFLAISCTLAQVSTTQIKADTIKIQARDGQLTGGELVIENSMKDSVNYFLVNAGDGRTTFKRVLKKINPSTYVIGGDTLTISGTTLQQAFDVENAKSILNKNDTVRIEDNAFLFDNNGGAKFKVDFRELGLGNGATDAAVTLDAQNYTGTGILYRGRDPGFVKMAVTNSLVPGDSVIAPYYNGASGYAMSNTYEGTIGQLLLGVNTNPYANKKLMLRGIGTTGIAIANDGKGSIEFRGGAADGENMYGGFAAISGNFGIKTLNAGQSLTVIGSASVTDSVILTKRILSTAFTDSTVVVDGGGVLKHVASMFTGTYTGNGGNSLITIPHGLGGVPTWVGSVNAQSDDAVGLFKVTYDNTNIYVAYTASTPVGTGNIVLSWAAKL